MRHVPLHERVYHELRDAIMTARLRPGEAITLRGLAEELGTSAMPIRDAVHRLVSVRALEVLSNRTVRVPVLLQERFAELTHVRRVLEAAAAEAATARMTTENIAALEASNRAMETALKRNDVRATFRENRAFHFALYHAAGNDLLVSMIGDLWLLAGPYLSLSWDGTSGKQKSAAAVVPNYHRALIKALRSKDGAAAAKAVSADIQETASLVLRNPLFTQTLASEQQGASRRLRRLRVQSGADVG